jgi:hypothetical protein
MALAHCGTALAFGLSPALIQAGGWGWAFYAFAAAALAWALPWARMDSDLKRVAAATAAVAAANAAAHPQAAAAAAAAAHAHAHAHPHHPGGADPNVGFWPLMRRKEVWAIGVAQYASSFGERRRRRRPALAGQGGGRTDPPGALLASTAPGPPFTRASAPSPSTINPPGFYGLLAWLPQFLLENCGLQLSQVGGA